MLLAIGSWEGSGAVTGAAVAYLRARGPISVEESVGIDVPVDTAYNQWTQFEQERAGDFEWREAAHDSRVPEPIRELAGARGGGSKATLWHLPDSDHTEGLTVHPGAYREHVLSLLGQSLGQQ